MTEIRVIDLCGPICLDLDDGAKLGEQVRAILDRGETVCLDFQGVKTLGGPFLNTAVGFLHGFFRQDDLERRLLWKGLDSITEDVLRLVQRNAIRFYSATPSQQEALLAASARYPGE